MGESAREKLEGYTYADYLRWDNEKRMELIEGIECMREMVHNELKDGEEDPI